MQLIDHENAELQRQAILSVSKLLVQNWQVRMRTNLVNGKGYRSLTHPGSSTRLSDRPWAQKAPVLKPCTNYKGPLLCLDQAACFSIRWNRWTVEFAPGTGGVVM